MNLLLISLALASLTLANPTGVCIQAPYRAILPLSNNCFAESFCSKYFPVAPVTKTALALTSTSTFSTSITSTFSSTTTTTSTAFVTATASTTTTLPTTTTVTSTTTFSQTDTTTSVATVTPTASTTVVTDSAGVIYKRSAAAEPLITPAIEARDVRSDLHGYSTNKRAQSSSSAWSLLASKITSSKSFISTACSCIATPRIVLITSTPIVTTTKTSIASSTTTFTSTVLTTSTQTDTATFTMYTTDTATSTISTTSTTTVTARATVIAEPAIFNACGQNFAAPISAQSFGVRCGFTYGGSVTLRSSAQVASYDACLAAGDADFFSNSFTFQFSTKTCNIYHNIGDNSLQAANPDFVYSYFYP